MTKRNISSKISFYFATMKLKINFANSFIQVEFSMADEVLLYLTKRRETLK